MYLSNTIYQWVEIAMKKEYKFKYFRKSFLLNLLIFVCIVFAAIFVVQQTAIFTNPELFYIYHTLALIIGSGTFIGAFIIDIKSHVVGTGILYEDRVEIHVDKKVYIVKYTNIANITKSRGGYSLPYFAICCKNRSIISICIGSEYKTTTLLDFIYALIDKIKEETGHEICKEYLHI